MKYHINPETGNPNQCKASIKGCPYKDEKGLPVTHYHSKEEARLAYEERYKSQILKNTSSKKDADNEDSRQKKKKLIESFYTTELQFLEVEYAIRNVNQIYGESQDEVTTLDNQRLELKKKKRLIYEDLYDLSWNTKDDAAYDDSIIYEVNSEILNITTPRWQTYSMMNEAKLQVSKELLKISKVWLDRLSSAELKAVLIYTDDSTDYSHYMRTGRPTEDNYEGLSNEEWGLMNEHLENAIQKAPKIKEPITIYTGVRNYTREELKNNAKTYNSNRVTSWTIDPDIAAMYSTGDNGVVVTRKIERIAAPMVITKHKEELEVFQPPIELPVAKIEHGVEAYNEYVPRIHKDRVTTLVTLEEETDE